MKKLLLIITLLSIVSISFGQWSSYGVRALAKSNDYFVVKNADNANTQKMSLTTLTHIADSTRAAQDDTIEYNSGLNADGSYNLETGSNYLTAAKFAAASRTQSIHNATYILDSIVASINVFQVSNGTYSIIQSNCQDTADGEYATAINFQNSAQGDGSFAHGSNAVAYKATVRAFASGSVLLKGVSQWGANQYIEVVEYLQTTDATADSLVIGGTNDYYLTIPTDMVGQFEVTLVGSANSGTIGETYTRRIGGAIKNLAGTTSLVGTVDTLGNYADAGTSTWLCSVTADDVTDALMIEVTGEAGRTIHWTAYIRMTTVGIRNFNIE